ncbi:MAG: CocE/NonD family hydrolase [Opitutaceae bacterium]
MRIPHPDARWCEALHVGAGAERRVDDAPVLNHADALWRRTVWRGRVFHGGGPAAAILKAGYIWVRQDVRGRRLSEGKFTRR